MNTNNQARALQSKFKELEKTKSDLIRLLENESAKTLNKKKEGKWSINQILYHHYLAEKLTVEYVQTTLAESESPTKAGITEYVKSKLLNMLLWLPLKFKSPKRIGNLPETIEFNSLVSDWSGIRQELSEIITSFPERYVGAKIFNHPRVGMLTMQQTLEFLNAHLKHHLPQIKNQL